MLNQGWVYHDRIRARHQGQTVLAFYTQAYPHWSAAQWRDRIWAGQMRLDDQPVTPDTVLTAGQTLSYHRPPWQEPAAPLNFEILQRDRAFLLVNKPSGLPVLPGGGFLDHTLLHQLKQIEPEIAPIHRLGRGTSGIMLWARTAHARVQLNQQMRDRTITKTYRALVPHWSHPDTLTITDGIGKLPHPTLGTIYAATPSGKPSESRVQVVARRVDGVLLDVTIPTGRPHQIRIHLAAVGHPLLGDPLYAPGGQPILTPHPHTGTYPVPGDCGYHLHAHRLTFTHPETGDAIAAHCPPPPRLCAATEGITG
ncbi:RluA family pseudouridine synthase [Spirulina major]|uniref:RluA family pseudouridine synthase n=1 Tax=Spirulina major TaxID=270636 RepID=UPI0009331E7F|nr:RluA family pseudouridine synthase [Spirulina major]